MMQQKKKNDEITYLKIKNTMCVTFLIYTASIEMRIQQAKKLKPKESEQVLDCQMHQQPSSEGGSSYFEESYSAEGYDNVFWSGINSRRQQQKKRKNKDKDI